MIPRREVELFIYIRLKRIKKVGTRCKRAPAGMIPRKEVEFFIYKRTKKMDKIIVLLSLISLTCCTKKTYEYDYVFIKNEIKTYDKLLLVKTLDYLNNNIEKERINSLHSKLLEISFETDILIDVIKTNDIEKINFDAYDNYLKNNFNDCYSVEEVKTNALKDTLYLHNVKFKFIKCVLKNSRYYDSIPELQKRF